MSPLLVLGATHHHLIEERQRMKVGLIVETGEARLAFRHTAKQSYAIVMPLTACSTATALLVCAVMVVIPDERGHSGRRT